MIKHSLVFSLALNFSLTGATDYWAKEITAKLLHITADISDCYLIFITSEELRSDSERRGVLRDSVTLRFAALSCELMVIRSSAEPDVGCQSLLDVS